MVEDAPRLYLITPAIADAASFAAPFETALAAAAADVACVLLRIVAEDPAEVNKTARALLPLAQARGVACLLESLPVALDTGADGVHVKGFGDELEAALASLKPGGIVGIGGIASRDDAMRAGEADVDYLMFGGPEDARPFAEIRDRVAWWAEIFNVPCVAYAHRLDEVAAFARAGADFVALGAAIWDDRRGPASAVADAAQALAGIRETTG
jgi:thiamine-phosphate pyrophosphorylase